MAKFKFWDILGRLANVLQVSGGLPEPFGAILRKLVGSSLMLAAIAVVQKWFQTFSRLDPALRWACAAAVISAIVLAVIWGGVGLRALWSRARDSSSQPLVANGDTAKPKPRPLAPRPLAQNELDDVRWPLAIEHPEVGTRWRWNGHEAQGPFCPVHGEPLKFVRYSGGNTHDMYSDFEEEYFGASWFGCPEDAQEVFRVLEHIKVKALRWRVGERFRQKYGIQSVEEPLNEQEREVRRLARENAARLFRPPQPPS